MRLKTSPQSQKPSSPPRSRGVQNAVKTGCRRGINRANGKLLPLGQSLAGLLLKAAKAGRNL